MRKTALALIVLPFFLATCKKDPGEGGTSSIKGKIWLRNYNSTFSTLYGAYAGTDRDVYIIYGTDASYGNKAKSGPDGVFEFKYLRKGNYKIYVYSKDSATTVGPPQNLNAPNIAIIKNVTISQRKEVVDAGTITILN